MNLMRHEVVKQSHLTYNDAAKNSHKFYQLILFKNVYEDGRVSFEVKRCWGRIGTIGQAKADEYSSKEDAERRFSFFRKEKLAKGYQLTWKPQALGQLMNLMRHEVVKQSHLTYNDAAKNSHKFYQLILFKNVYEDGRVSFEVKRCWGRIGTIGQAKADEFPRKGDAEQEFFSLRDSKMEKGYRVSKSETTDSPPNINVSVTPTDFASQFQMFVEEGEG